MSSALVSDDNGTTTGHIETSEADESSDYAALWQFEDLGEGTYRLRNLNAGYYLASRDHATVADAAQASTFTLGEGASATNWTLAVTNNEALQENVYLNAHHCDDSNQGNPNSHAIGTWKNGASDAGNLWMLQEVNTVTLNVGPDGWATLCLPFAVSLPGEVKAYTGSEKTADAVVLSPVKGTLPALTPVVIEAAEGSYTLPIDYDDATAAPDNVFQGTTVRLEGLTPGSFYALANPADGNGTGFYVGSDDVTGITANKAYMTRPEGSTAAGYRFIFGDDATVGIDHAATDGATDGNKAYYDLQGRRVLYPSNGIYVTADGQKVFIK